MPGEAMGRLETEALQGVLSFHMISRSKLNRQIRGMPIRVEGRCIAKNYKNRVSRDAGQCR